MRRVPEPGRDHMAECWLAPYVPHGPRPTAGRRCGGVSLAGRRRRRRVRPAVRLGARTTATLAALTLTAALAVPAATAPGRSRRDRPVRGAAAGALLTAPTD